MMPEMVNRQSAFTEEDLNLEDSDYEKTEAIRSHMGSEEENNYEKDS